MQEKTIDLNSIFPIFRAVNQSLVFTWLGAVLCTIFFYAITASSPLLGEIAWSDAARFGTQWWLISFGAHIAVGDGMLSLMPTLFTGIILFSAYIALRKCRVLDWIDVGLTILFTAITVSIIGLVSVASGPWWIAIIGASLLFALVSIIAGRENLLVPLPWWTYVEQAWPRIRTLLIGTGVITTLTFVTAFIVGFGKIAEINASYFQTAIGISGLVLIQLIYLPTYLFWTTAWLLGAGFSAGVGTSFSIMGNTVAPLPAIPVFGALPSYGAGTGWLIILPILFYAVLGVLNTRHLSLAKLTKKGVTADRHSDSSEPQPHEDQLDVLRNSVIASLVFVVICALTALFGSGSIGPGRMAQFGSEPALVLGYALLVAVLPFLASALLAHPETIITIRSFSSSSQQSVKRLGERGISKKIFAKNSKEKEAPKDVVNPADDVASVSQDEQREGSVGASETVAPSASGDGGLSDRGFQPRHELVGDMGNKNETPLLDDTATASQETSAETSHNLKEKSTDAGMEPETSSES
ncbi:cell division protein PerM [Arcanobacterium ihumii]|uniref:cell division protein PerM n=1 Tax=Arcanobacterium ihumii TaxID=2138162 RepID=UPI00135A09F4|nr:DUF6350 family protein [Arcanobacterium ihumii]